MRFALDGLPRDLPLTPKQRRDLLTRVHAYRPRGTFQRQLPITLIPAGISILGSALWMPALFNLPKPWNFAVTLLVLIATTSVIFWIVPRALWRLRHEALAACGFPVCFSCAYPITDLENPQCPECGEPSLGKHHRPPTVL